MSLTRLAAGAERRGTENAPAPLDELAATPSLPALEEQVLARWAASQVRERSAARTAGGPVWHCDQPPWPASGMPGLHHARIAVIADLYSRYRTMRGYHVPGSAGWDCHGLAVEVAVERELGLAGAQDVEKYGVERFAERCREHACRHIDAQAASLRRIGCLACQSDARRTMDKDHIESAWSSLRLMFDAGLLVRRYGVGPYCPRCQTPLAEHAVGRPGGRRKIAERAVTVRLRLVGWPEGANPHLRGADLLVQSARPWTLVASPGVAVHPGGTYAVARQAGRDDRVVVADAVSARTLGEGWHVAARLRGAELAGTRCAPAFGASGQAEPQHVVAAEFVRTTIGTGLVHLAPALDERDEQVAREHGLPVVNPLGPDGRFDVRLPLVGGAFFTDCDQILIADMADRGILFSSCRRERSRPHCWRCGTPLVGRLKLAWHVVSHDGAAAAALSLARYWGTPLPIWECPDGHLTCFGSLAELAAAVGRDLAGIDPHRPHIDRLAVACRRCQAPARRVAEVADAWYDRAVMSLAQPGQRARARQLSLGTTNDRDGRPMGATAGNVVAPPTLVEQRGADALRWMLAAWPPQAARQASSAELASIERDVLLTYWNMARFLVGCSPAAVAGRPGAPAQPGACATPPDRRPVLDRWALSELNRLVIDVTEAFDAFDAPRAVGRIRGYVGDLSNWYLRGSRRRLARGTGTAADAATGPGEAAGAAGLATLHSCLEVLTKLLAPVAPFISDQVWSLIRSEGSADSVHLADWPVGAASLVDTRLADQMALARRLVRLGRAARSTARIGVRQPLATALVAVGRLAELPADIRAVVAQELNVLAIDRLSGPPPSGWAVAADRVAAVALDVEITADLRLAGLARRVVRAIQVARKRDGLAVPERVCVHWKSADPDLALAMARHGPAIGAAVGAAELVAWSPADGLAAGRADAVEDPHAGHDDQLATAHVEPGLSLAFWLRRQGS